MSRELATIALEIAKNIQSDSLDLFKPPEEGTPSKTQHVIAFSIVKGTQPYVEKIVNQINGAYEHGWYDACAVMIRRLVETLIIESFETYKIAHKIQNANGDFYYLKDLISAALNESSWNLGRNTKSGLPKLKDIGDKSAHSRRYIAHRSDIDKITSELRDVVQELVLLAKLK